MAVNEPVVDNWEDAQQEAPVEKHPRLASVASQPAPQALTGFRATAGWTLILGAGLAVWIAVIYAFLRLLTGTFS